VNAPILLLTSFLQDHTMKFNGDLDFKEGRSPSQTTTILLQRCLGCAKGVEMKGIGEFLEGLFIKPMAFFRDIDTDWLSKPFIGQHVFKVVQAAGYGGTENDLWVSVTEHPAPYAIKKSRAQVKKPRSPKTAV
jgi:hypothetical protein